MLTRHDIFPRVDGQYLTLKLFILHSKIKNKKNLLVISKSDANLDTII